MRSKFDLDASILSGGELRTLLNSDHISYGEVHSCLKKKGVFIGRSDKSVTVPLLSATLLTPTEFTDLIEASVDRESQPKNKVSSIDLVPGGGDWVASLRDLPLSTKSDLSVDHEAIDFVTMPHVEIESGKVRIPYVINKKDYSKEWLERELEFEGEVSIEKKGNALVLEFSSTHSSKETEEINRKIVNQVSKVLKRNNIATSSNPRAITFGSFSNIERVRFFKRLTASVQGRLGLGKVDNIEISLVNSGADLPNDPEVSWMKRVVKGLRISGEKLNDIFLINNEKYYPYYSIQKMDVDYEFKFKTNEGQCRFCFSFSGPGKGVSEQSELVFSCVNLRFKNRVNEFAKKETSKVIHNSIKDLIEEKYQLMLKEREKVKG